MKTSEQTPQIAKALSAAQGEMKNPEKNRRATIPMKSGGKYEYNYADLPCTIDTARAALSKNGLGHTAAITLVEGHCILSVRLTHDSGEWYESEIVLPEATDPKGFAANYTYFRRYLLTGLIGVAADDDLDSEPEADATYDQRRAPTWREPSKPMGSSAPLPKPKITPEPAPNFGAPPTVPSPVKFAGPSAADRNMLVSRIRFKNIADETVLAHLSMAFGKTKLTELTPEEFAKMAAWVDSRMMVREPGDDHDVDPTLFPNT